MSDSFSRPLANIDSTIILDRGDVGSPVAGIYKVDLSRDHCDTSTLDTEEKKRSARFKDARSRSDFIAMRTALRAVLAAELDCTEKEIVFGYENYGKPFLVRPVDSVHFNISHTEGMGVIALSHRSALGVDVERVRPERDLLEIANRFFSRSEADQVKATAGSSMLRAFFRVWTRKEAVLKLLGSGLSTPLDRFSVSADKFARILESELPELARPCSLLNLSLGSDFEGCLAYWGDNLDEEPFGGERFF